MLIKKRTLWIIFIALIVIVLILIINPFKGSSGTSFDVSAFTSDPSLYPSLGADNVTNAAVPTVIEFSDFQCPVCGLASGLPSWSSQYSTEKSYNIAGKVENAAKQGQLRFISVTMSFLGQGSIYAAEAGLCANDQGKFWEMHDLIYSNQVPPAQEGTQFTKSQLEEMGKSISGLNQTMFTNCVEKEQHLFDVQKMSDAAGSAGVQGTPTFAVNGKLLSDWTSVQTYINANQIAQ